MKNTPHYKFVTYGFYSQISDQPILLFKYSLTLNPKKGPPVTTGGPFMNNVKYSTSKEKQIFSRITKKELSPFLAEGHGEALRIARRTRSVRTEQSEYG